MQTRDCNPMHQCVGAASIAVRKMTAAHPLLRKPDSALVDFMTRVHRQFVSDLVELDWPRLQALPAATIYREIRRTAASLCSRMAARERFVYSLWERSWLIDAILDQAFGLGPLEGLLRDPAIDAAIIRGPRDLLVECEGQTRQTAVVFRDREHVQQVLDRNPCKYCVTEVHAPQGRAVRIDLRRLRNALAAAMML